VAASTLLPAPAMASTAGVAFRIQDPRITEASGIAAGLASPGVVYVQNDSGDTNRVFALDGSSGATVATVTIAGAQAHDWEDIAVAPDAAGTPSLWIADTGDNDADRDEVQVYRVDEPSLRPAQPDRTVTTADADVWRLRYPGGPVDVESLAVTPAGTAYLVTKSLVGRSVVYRLPARPDPTRVQTPARAGSITFTQTGTPNPFGVIGQLTATGAAISPDGRLLVVRTYADAWVWRVGAGGVAAALRTAPTRIALPRQKQGEGVAVDGTRLLVDSEGSRSPVWSVPLRAAPATGASDSSAATTTHRSQHGGRGGGIAVVVGLVALAVLGGLWSRARVRGRRRRETR